MALEPSPRQGRGRAARVLLARIPLHLELLLAPHVQSDIIALPLLRNILVHPDICAHLECMTLHNSRHALLDIIVQEQMGRRHVGPA